MLNNTGMEIIFCGTKMAAQMDCFRNTFISFDGHLGGHFVSIQNYFTSYIYQHVEIIIQQMQMISLSYLLTFSWDAYTKVFIDILDILDQGISDPLGICW